MIDKKKQGVYLTWQNVNVAAKQKKILSDCNGYSLPGQILAIMGPSGAGKTTLLSILAMKGSKNLKVDGKIQANNSTYNSRTFYSFASFVYQNDILNEALTVRQTLQFIAKLKIRDDNQAIHRVNQLINQFSLQKCQNTYVGGKIIKGISGGEKKRLCIAIEMVSQPKMLILDEPTSGLDSHIANSVIKILKKVAEQGRTIVLTIHQPSYRIYSQLDRLILLNEGKTVYQGQGQHILTYMQQKLQIPPPQNTTVCDYFMFQISDYKQKLSGKRSSLNYQAHQKYQKGEIENQINSIKEQQLIELKAQKPQRSMLEQFVILLKRQAKLFVRNPMRLGRSIGNAILTIVIIGIIFLNTISDGRPEPVQSGHQYFPLELVFYFIDAQGLCFINVTSIMMTGIFSVALVFPVQRQVYSKQTASKTYNTLPYFVSKLIVQFLTLLFSIMIYCSGVYWMCGFRKDFVSFLGFVLTLGTLGLVGNSIGLMTGSLFKNAQRASSMAPVLLLPLMMFSGLYNKLGSIPSWIAWLQYISPFRYGLHALLLNQFKDQKYLQYSKQIFDYREDQSINLDYGANISICFCLSVFYYTLAFVFLKKLSSQVSA